MALPKNFAFLPWASNQAAVSTAVMTVTSEASGFSASNLQTIYVPETWRSSSTADQSIAFDFGSAKGFNFIGIVGHNISSGATVTVKAGSSASPDGSQFTRTLTWRERDMYVVVTTGQSYRYVTVVISDASNPDGYVEASAVLVGTLSETAVQYEQNWVSGRVFLNRDQKTNYGTPLTENLSDQISMQCLFTGQSETQIDALYASLVELSQATVLPMFIIPRPRLYSGFFGRLSYHEPPKRGPVCELECQFLEDPLGVEVGA